MYKAAHSLEAFMILYSCCCVGGVVRVDQQWNWTDEERVVHPLMPDERITFSHSRVS